MSRLAADTPAAEAPGQEPAIAVHGLEKIYGGYHGEPPKRALKGIDLTIRRGAIFGLLGPNGAGKSTCINILAGLVRKTAGTARIWGFDIDRNPRNAKASIGIVPQEIYFDAFFTPREMMELQAGLYGVPKAERRTDEILSAVQLLDKADSYSRTLSGGMKRRLLVAKAMVHNPPILVLDEPTAGVDVELRQQLWAYVRELNDRGVTIVLTTHYLEEAEKLCDEIAIINHGEVVACAPTRALLSQIDEKVVVIHSRQSLDRLPDLPGFRLTRRDAHTFAVSYTPESGQVVAVIERVKAAGVDIVDVTTEQSDLEDIFLQLTRKK